MRTVLVVGAAGFIGANVRYWFSVLFAGWFGQTYPYGTLIINVTGSALLGVFLAWAAKQTSLAPEIRLFIAVGFFGAYTTFSSFANETVALIQQEKWLSALGYIVLTNLLCIVGAALGMMFGSRL